MLKNFGLFLGLSVLGFIIYYAIFFLYQFLDQKHKDNEKASSSVLCNIVGYFLIFFTYLKYFIPVLTIFYCLGWNKLLVWSASILIVVSCVYATAMTVNAAITNVILYGYKSGYLWITAFFYNWFNMLLIMTSTSTLFEVVYGSFPALADSLLRYAIFFADVACLIYSLAKIKSRNKQNS